MSGFHEYLRRLVRHDHDHSDRPPGRRQVLDHDDVAPRAHSDVVHVVEIGLDLVVVEDDLDELVLDVERPDAVVAFRRPEDDAARRNIPVGPLAAIGLLGAANADGIAVPEGFTVRRVTKSR